MQLLAGLGSNPSASATAFDYADLRKVYHTLRAGSAGIVAVASLVVWMGWDRVEAAVALALTLVVVADALRRRRRGDASPLVPLLIDTTALGIGLGVAHLVVVGAPFTYLAVASLLLLSWRRAVWMLVYSGGWLGVALALPRLVDFPPWGPELELPINALIVLVYLLQTVILLMAAARASRERQDLHRLASFQASLLDQVRSAVIATDPQGQIIYWNRFATELYGWGAEEVMGRNVMEVTVPEAERENAKRIMAGMVEDGYWEGEFPARRRDGTTVPAQVVDALIRNEEGEVVGVVGVSVDISEQKRIRDRLEELLRTKDQFLASVSHELRTPLTAVLGFSEELHSTWRELDDTHRQELLGILAAQAREMADLVEDLLVAARADLGSLQVVPETLEVGAELQSVMRFLGLDQAGRVELPGDTANVLADPLRFRQILRNLLSNALSYGGDRVRVTTRANGAGIVRIEVRDNGTEIPLEERERVFEPYQRAHQSRGIPSSMGLGLHVSRQLARLMGGDLSYRYEEGESVFEVVLPTA